MTQDFKRLEVWKNAHAFTLAVYGITTTFPPSEQYGLTPQMRKAAASVVANIAEGCGRGSARDFVRFLYNAYGSIKECESFLLLAQDLGYVNERDFRELTADIDSLSRMLNCLIESVKIKIEKDSSSEGATPRLTTQNRRSE